VMRIVVERKSFVTELAVVAVVISRINKKSPITNQTLAR
jgi:hypothetical protein